MKTVPVVKFISRTTGEEFNSEILPDGAQPEYNFKTDIFNFSDVFDFKVGLNKEGIQNLKSHDFVEFGYTVDGKFFEVGVGYICKFQDSESDQGIELLGNGRDLLGRLIDSPFRKGVQVEKQTLRDIYLSICKGEYVEQYAQLKSRKGYIVPNDMYQGAMLFVTRSDQLKGRILQQYTNTLSLNIAYSNHLGQIVIRGRHRTVSDGEIMGTIYDYGDKQNVSKIVVNNDYDSAFSDAVIQYSSGEANVADSNKTGNPIVNSDSRVKGVVNRRLIEALNVNEAKDFAGSVDPRQRVNELAYHKLRVSNRGLNSVGIQTNLPFMVIDKKIVPLRIGQYWRLNSYRKKFKTNDHPDGTKEVVMLLSGISHSFSLSGFNFDLQFVEVDTVC